jgi:hypothetical protein
MSDPKPREVEDLLRRWGPKLDAKIAALDAAVDAEPPKAEPSAVAPHGGAHRGTRPPIPPSDGSSLFERLLAAEATEPWRRA